MATVRAGDEVILFDPCYDSYEPSVRLAGGRAVRIPLAPPAFAIDWQRVADGDHAAHADDRDQLAAQSHRQRARRGGPRPARGAGAAARPAGAVRRGLRAPGLRRRARTTSVLARPALAARAFAVFSFGKTYHATGWKTGYCVAPPALTRGVPPRAPVRDLRGGHADPARAGGFHGRGDPGSRGRVARRSTRPSATCSARCSPARAGARCPAAGTYFQLLDYSAIGDVGRRGDGRGTGQRATAWPRSRCRCSTSARRAMRLLRFCFAKQDETLVRAAAVAMQDLSVTIFQQDLAWQDAPANRAQFARCCRQPRGGALVLLPEMFATGFTMEPAACAEGMRWPHVRLAARAGGAARMRDRRQPRDRRGRGVSQPLPVRAPGRRARALRQAPPVPHGRRASRLLSRAASGA